jgi:hypothetical protein
MTVNTWLRRVAEKYRSAPFANPNGAGATLIGYLAGLVPDALDETCLQAVRMALPNRGVSPPSALPFLLRAFGLPTYEGETYAQTFARLEDVWPTHARAGTPGGLTIELNRLPGVSGYIYEISSEEPTYSTGDFWAMVDGVVDGEVLYGAPTYGGFLYGRSGITLADEARIRACMLYWRSGRSRYRGVREPL